MYFSINKLLSREVATPVLIGVGAFGLGVFSGYYLFGKPKENFVVIEEDEQMSLFEYAEENQEVFEEIKETKYEQVKKNVFEQYNSQWDWDIELMHREDNSIYVIHYDEFVNNESNYPQETLTYYSGDDILTDQMNTPIYDYPKMIGPINFGHGSNDPNVVFIRNDEIHMEWEILRDYGKYQIEVLGYDIEETYEAADLKHSNNYKFREE